MPSSPNRIARLGLGAAALVVVVAVGLLIANLINRFGHQPTTSPVAAQVMTVTPTGPSSIRIEARLRLKSSTSAEVNCVNAVALPAVPLAFQSIVPVHLNAGVSTPLVINRDLIHPDADRVTPSDVSLVCT